MATSEPEPRHNRPLKRGICCRCCNYHGICVCATSIHMTCWRVFKWFPVLLISAIICWSYYAYVVQLCIYTLSNAVQRCVYLILYHILLNLLVWSYVRTIFTDIKRVPEKYKLPQSDVERLMRAESEDEQRSILENFAKDLPVVTRTSSGAVRYCNRCVLVKPDRAHHCSICSKCVLKMDHHCPWINNCVCFYNYKFFVLFLGYALVYCLFIALTCLPYFIQFWKGGLGNSASTGRYHIVFAFFVSIMFAVSLGSLFFYHCYLVAHNRTTLESFRAPMFRGGEDKNGFSMGCFKNFKEVFGDTPIFWFVPVFTSRGNGCDFPVRGEHEHHSFTTPLEHHRYESMGTTRSSFGDGIVFPQPAKGEDTESLLSSERWDRWGERALPFDDRDTSSYDDVFD